MKLKYLLFVLPLFVYAVQNPPNRPSKAPFISGDAFREYSDYCYDEVDSSLNPLEVLPFSTVFVKSDYIERFFAKIHPKISSPYILISHNSDGAMPGNCTQFLDDEKLIAWFGQNYDGYPHPKLHPIPIGVANFCWEHGNTGLIKMVQAKQYSKKRLALINFAAGTYPLERNFIIKNFAKTKYCDYFGQQKVAAYLRETASSIYSFAPRGNGLDTHRLWEALYLGTIPIVKSSSLDSLYSDLPVLIVSDWNEVNQAFLEENYEKIKQGSFAMEKLSTDYWFSLIDSYKR